MDDLAAATTLAKLDQHLAALRESGELEVIRGDDGEATYKMTDKGWQRLAELARPYREISADRRNMIAVALHSLKENKTFTVKGRTCAVTEEGQQLVKQILTDMDTLEALLRNGRDDLLR